MAFPPTDESAVATIGRRDYLGEVLKLAALSLISVVWTSSAIFGLYIVFVFIDAAVHGAPDRWNRTLPGLYEAHSSLATVGIGAHFVTGTVLVLIGPLQLVRSVRESVPRVHRWLGRAYAFAAFVSGLDGLAFILQRGTIGGWPMDVGFGLYGFLMALSSVAAVWYARRRETSAHRAWAIRIFALVIGSWLYRMEYGIWSLVAPGHTPVFDGTFDRIMTVFFYVPNLIVAEVFIRARDVHVRPAAKGAAALLLGLATFFVAVGTYYFTAYQWGPPIMARFR
jgi:hypothetical protein